jgi:hypothetical protein
MVKNAVKVSIWIFITVVGLVFAGKSAAENSHYQEIEWIQLMPKDDLDALLNPPDYLYDIEDGSEQDTLEGLDAKPFENEQDKRYQQALSSARVIDSYNNTNIRIPGFIVPLESEEGKSITEFFIVPYFGACLHLPPPPPNQIIYVNFEQGVELKSLYDAFWFEGKLTIDTVENELGTSAYQLKIDRVLPYED